MYLEINFVIVSNNSPFCRVGGYWRGGLKRGGGLIKYSSSRGGGLLEGGLKRGRGLIRGNTVTKQHDKFLLLPAYLNYYIRFISVRCTASVIVTL